MRFAFPILVGRAVQFLARARGGKGSGMPGLVANRLAPRLLPMTLNGFTDGLVLVSGTSGKSTTTKMLAAILRGHGLGVFTNSSTANLPQGLTSAILDQGDWRGRIDADIAVIELDEAHGARMAGELRARVVVLTNVMLDDIERYESMDRVGELLRTIALRATEAIVLNADDAAFGPLAASVTAELGVTARWFGVAQAVLDNQPHGLGYASTAARRREPGNGTIVESVDGRSARLNIGGERVEVLLPARGAYFAVNAAGAIEAAKQVLGDRFDSNTAIAELNAIEPVFARGETVSIGGQEVELALFQNTASFQLTIDGLEPGHAQLFIGIGTEEQDPSWLWTVDTSALGRVDIVAGPKAEEMAARLVYDGVSVVAIERNILRAFDRFLALPPPPTGRKTALFTAQCMRAIRGHHGLVHAELSAARHG